MHKKIIRLALCFVIGFGFSQYTTGQQWSVLMQNPESKFSETVKAAEAWFGIHGTSKGSGWKQFKRVPTVNLRM